MRRYFDMNLEIDVRDILPAVHVPTLVMHHEDDKQVPYANSEYLAKAVKGARLVNCGSGGHYYWSADNDRVVEEVRSFLFGDNSTPAGTDRILATVLFTDIVDSTRELSKRGDAAWRSLLQKHESEASDLIELHRGRFVKSTGDGIVATFDGPGRAVQCACRLVAQIERHGIHIRAGLHTGEIELRGDDIAGTAVHIAARIEEAAAPGEVIVSRTVADVMAGNDSVNFVDLGRRKPKGLPGDRTLLRAMNASL